MYTAIKLLGRLAWQPVPDATSTAKVVKFLTATDTIALAGLGFVGLFGWKNAKRLLGRAFG
jgi:hypothetical protein